MLSKEVMFLAIIALLLSVIVWTQVSSSNIEALENEIIISYHPEINKVCISKSTNFYCPFWWELLEVGHSMNRNQAWQSIYGDMN